MLMPIALFVLSAVVILIAGTKLSQYGDRIAEHTGLGRLWIGVVLLAGATSLPEVFTAVSAVLLDAPNIAIAGFALAALGILVAAPLLAESAKELAEATGLSTTFIGTSLVAITTSLPELVTTFAAVRLGAFDLAVGNLFGSNAFNMAILVLGRILPIGKTSCWRPWNRPTPFTAFVSILLVA